MTSDRRVLHLVTSTQRRGAEVLASQLAPALDGLGWSSTVIALTAGEPGGLDIPTLGGRRLSPQTLSALRGKMRQADVVIAHGSSTLPACVLAGAGLDVPVVYRSVGDPRYWAPTTVKRVRTAMLMRQADRVVALTEEASSALRSHYGLRPDRVVVIPKGVDAARLRERTPPLARAARDALSLPAGPRVALYLGALSPEKNAAMAIEAAARIPELLLVLAGEGPDRADLEQLAGRVLPGRFRFLGQIADPLQALTAADLLVLPSKTEGMPGAAMEAGIVGIPVVTTDVGWVRDIVIDGVTGAVVPTGDVDRFSAGMEAVLANGAAFGAAARQHCLARFDMAEVATRWSAMIAELA